MYFHERPEWASIDENGKVSEYLFGRKVSCPASDPYMDHMLNVLDHVFTQYKPRYWGFDGRWLSHWEVGGYRPGPKGAGPDPCYAKDHGHLPGDNLYKEWKNIQNLLRELRRRHFRGSARSILRSQARRPVGSCATSMLTRTTTRPMA